MCNSGQTFWNESLKTSMPLKQRCGPEFVCWVSPNSRPASISVVRCSSVGEPENRPECCFFGQALLLLLLPQNSCKAKLKGSLDVELIRQEAEHGALDIRALTTSILGTTAVLCAFSRWGSARTAKPHRPSWASQVGVALLCLADQQKHQQ